MTKLEEPQIPAPPDVHMRIRERYTAKAEKISEPNAWSRVHITITDNLEERVVYEYDRNYSFLRTFEPFRQWDGSEWHNYALISPQYSTFQVLDLESGEVVAERPYPQRDWYRDPKTGYDQYEKYLKDHPEWFEPGGWYEGKGPNDKIDGEGFCAVEFYVPDWATNEDITSEDEWNEAAKYDWNEVLTGVHGFVSGCYWGDDSSWKIEYIDLSKIDQGEVSEDARFGYLELPTQIQLKDAVNVNYGCVGIATNLYYDVGTGKLKSWQRNYLPEFEEEKK